MLQHMLLQTMVRYKRHAAFRALFVLTAVDLPDVCREVVLDVVLLRAHLASERVGHVVCLGHVFDSIVVVLHGF